ncbi:MAG: tetratricopeptide repeat protein [Pseudomonadota bacterium]
MSLIFNTVKKLKGPPRKDQRKVVKKKRGNILSFHDLLFSPLGITLVIIGLVVLVVLGGAISQLISSKTPKQISPSDVSYQNNMSSNMQPAGVPGPPGSGPGMQPGGGNPMMDMGAGGENIPGTIAEAKKDEFDCEHPINAEETVASASVSELPAIVRGMIVADVALQPENAAKKADEQTTAVVAAGKGNIDQSGSTSEKKPLKPLSDQKAVSIPPKPEIIPLKSGRKEKANIEKRKRISSLVSRIERAFQTSETGAGERLIKELVALKENESPYTLKLEAFSYMRQGDFKAAESLLVRVLEKKQDDFDAGINMTIVEIKTGRIKEARKRLSRLNELYPADKNISELMEKIR